MAAIKISTFWDVDLLLNVFILLAQVSVTLTESEDEARCLDQMGRGVRGELFLLVVLGNLKEQLE